MRARSRFRRAGTYARADPAVTADRIFKHVVTAGYMKEPVAPLLLPPFRPLSLCLSLNVSRHARKVSSAPRADARGSTIIRATRFNAGLARAKRTRPPFDTSPRGTHENSPDHGPREREDERKREREREGDGKGAGADPRCRVYNEILSCKR